MMVTIYYISISAFNKLYVTIFILLNIYIYLILCAIPDTYGKDCIPIMTIVINVNNNRAINITNNGIIS